MKETLSQYRAIQAIIWDYDGTLADTRHKNLIVTRRIVERVTGRSADEFPVLASVDIYGEMTTRAANWREMYQTEYNMTPEQTDWAGRLWSEYQLQDKTPVPMYDGVTAVLEALRHFPQGIVSQNARSNILAALHTQKTDHYFACIIGFEEVDIRRQKPEPDGLLRCIEELTGFSPGCLLYIGDHETDVRCAQNADRALLENDLNLQIISIAICHDDMTNPAQWTYSPDRIASSPNDIIQIVNQLS